MSNPSIAHNITKFTEREINQLFEAAKTVLRMPSFEIRTARATMGYGRLLILLPRRVGTAPERNQIKRWLKALFYQEKWYARGLDLIVLVRPPAREMDYKQIKELLSHVFAPTSGRAGASNS